jgi:hypothetical protein
VATVCRQEEERVAHTSVVAHASAGSGTPLLARLNAEWHERALQLFMVIVLAHWAEHLVQAWQYYALGWPSTEARGVLGLWFPFLVSSELLHYVYAVIMLCGIWMLRTGFVGRARVWWMVAFGIQFWHHIEHGLLQAQAILGQNILNSPVPLSVAQIWIPRIELHLIYNTIVFIPMVIAMYQHIFPTSAEAADLRCSCAFVPRAASVGSV